MRAQKGIDHVNKIYIMYNLLIGNRWNINIGDDGKMDG